ncbi:MAG TPA: hypothetical protein VLU25_15365 [Acidobacteriota bacterium]|nr:hypothetical protein [Acidobacteriota bacterium]
MKEEDFRPANAEEARPSLRRVLLFLLLPAITALVLLLLLRLYLGASAA